MDEKEAFLASLDVLPRDQRETIRRYFGLFPRGDDWRSVLASTLLLGIREVSDAGALLTASARDVAALLDRKPAPRPRQQSEKQDDWCPPTTRESWASPVRRKPHGPPQADLLLEAAGYSGREMDGVRSTFEAADRRGFGRLPWAALRRLAPAWLSPAQMEHAYWLGGRCERDGVDLAAFCQLHFAWCRCDPEAVGGLRRLFDAHATGRGGSMRPRDLRRLLLEQPCDRAARLVENAALLAALNLTHELTRARPEAEGAGSVTFAEFASLFGAAEQLPPPPPAPAPAPLAPARPGPARELDLRAERVAADVLGLDRADVRRVLTLWRQMSDCASGTVAAADALRGVLLLLGGDSADAAAWQRLLFRDHPRAEPVDGLAALGAARRWSAEHVARLRRAFADASGGRPRALLGGLLAAAHSPLREPDVACLRHMLGWPAALADPDLRTDAVTFSEWLVVAAQLERWRETRAAHLPDRQLRRARVVAGLFGMSEGSVAQAWRAFSCCASSEAGLVARREMEAAAGALLRGEGRAAASASAAAVLAEGEEYSFTDMLALLGALQAFGGADVHRAFAAFQRADPGRSGRLNTTGFSRALEAAGCGNADEPELLRSVRLLCGDGEGVGFIGLLLAVAVHQRTAGAWVTSLSSPMSPTRARPGAGAGGAPASPASPADAVFKASLRS